MTKEYYLLWRLAHYFIKEEHYRIITISPSHDEIWLEKEENKEIPVIRLLAKNFDWFNLLHKDMQKVTYHAEVLRKQFSTKNLCVKNIYISSLVPIDEYEFYLDKEHKLNPKLKSSSFSTIVVTTEEEPLQEKIKSLIGKELPLPDEESVDMQMVEGIKAATLAEASKAANEVKKRFDRIKKPYITYFLIAICVIMFGLMEFVGSSENTETLIDFGAKFNVAIEAGQWYRLITPIFLHIGFLHLLMNLFALLYLGSLVEKLYGHLRYGIIFLLSGITGVILSYLTNTSIAAGASGAIFGLMGALLFFGFIYPKVFIRTIGKDIIIILLLNLAVGFITPGIDNAGHVGGVIGGFLISAIIGLPQKYEASYSIGATIAVVLCLFIIVNQKLYIQTDLQKELSLISISSDYLGNESYQKLDQLLDQYGPKESTNVDYLLIDAFVDLQLADYNKAQETLERTLTIRPTAGAYYYLTFLYADLLLWDDAYEAANNAIRLDPYTIGIKDLIDQLDQFKQYYEENNS